MCIANCSQVGSEYPTFAGHRGWTRGRGWLCAGTRVNNNSNNNDTTSAPVPTATTPVGTQTHTLYTIAGLENDILYIPICLDSVVPKGDTCHYQREEIVRRYFNIIIYEIHSSRCIWFYGHT